MIDDNFNPTLDDVAAFLEHARRPHMAEAVRHAEKYRHEIGQIRRMYELREAALRKRLHKYEPPAPFEPPPDFTARPESSD